MKGIYIVLGIVIFLFLSFILGAYLMMDNSDEVTENDNVDVIGGEIDLQKVLAKVDPVTNNRAIELIQSADLDGMMRAGITSEESQFIIDQRLIDMDKLAEAVNKNVKDTVDEGESAVDKMAEGLNK